MSSKQENKESSTSTKEKEKLKQRLQTLFKQQEQEVNQKKASKSFQKKNLYSKKPQQLNGGEQPAQKLITKKGNTQQSSEHKSVKSKKIKKINGLLNREIPRKKFDEKQPRMHSEQSDPFAGPLKNNRNKKNWQKNKKSESLSAATTCEPKLNKSSKKNKKSKHSAPTKNEETVQPPTEIPLQNNGPQKLSKNQKKKAKKRAAAAAVGAASVSTQVNASKKRKLAQQETTTKSKKAKKQNMGLQKKSLSPHSSKHCVVGDEFDVSNISHLVEGGDYSADENDWNQHLPHAKYITDPMKYVGDQDSEENVDNFEDDDYESGDDPYNYSDLSEDGGEEEELNNFSPDDGDSDGNKLENENSVEDDEDGDDPYNYSDYIEDDEEEESYSDFDEDDYEEDEDSCSYSSDSEFSSNYDGSGDDTGKFFDSDDVGEEDKDYQLPEHVPEDLIIHSGTATKRDLLPEENVAFKDKKYMQIVELKDQADVKVIRQPKENQKEYLLKLTYKDNESIKIVKIVKHEEVVSPSAADVKDDCPKLVPIVDDDGFQLYNPNEEDGDNDVEDEHECMTNEEEEEEDSFDEYEEDDTMDSHSLGSEYTELDSDDADSLLSEDINDKYLNRSCNNADDYYSSEEENSYLAAVQKVDVIDATNCDYNNSIEIVKDKDKSGVFEQTPSHTLSKLVNVGSKVSIMSTTVVDDEKILSGKQENCDDEFKETPQRLCASTKQEDNSLVVLSADQSPDNSGPQQNNALEEPVSASPELDDFEENSKDNKLSAIRLKTTAQSLAGYKTIFCNAINANLVLVLLKDPFYIYGTVRLTLLAGTMEVYGHLLTKDKEVELFSPRGCSEIEISSKQTPAQENISKDKVKNILKHYESNFIMSDLEKIASGYEPGKDAIVILKRNEERKKIVQQFKKFMNENVFPNLQNITMDRPLYNSEYLLRCMINISVTEHKSLRLPEKWQRFAVTKNSRIMLVGGKGVGKSTLLRFLINKHITLYEKVLLIDLDIGQPEIFVPQTVSCSLVEKPLLGPGFLLNIQPEKSYAVGNTNIALCPHKYVEDVRSLIRYCLAQEKFQNIPWFVNTMGYNKGFGPELISVIASELPLTDVIQLQSNKAINNFDSLLSPLVVTKMPRNMFLEDVDNANENCQELNYRLHVWQSAVEQESRYQKEWDMSPKDMRYAILLTRLSEALQGHADWLSDCTPMNTSLDQLKLVNLMDNIPPCSPEELAKAMEANLVYLCHYEDDRSSVECLGIGVVRGIDYHVRQLYLLPAMSSLSLLKRVNCLALGEMPLPSTVLSNQGSRVQKTAPFVYNTIEAKASKAIKQIYHRPAKFLKGNRKSLN